MPINIARPGLLVLCLCLVGMSGGCIYADGAVSYHLKGRILDSGQQPVANAKVAAQFSPNGLTTPEGSTGVHRTDSNGRFELNLSRLGWGRQYLFGFIPLQSSEAPVPPPLKEVSIYVSDTNQWQMSRVLLNDSNQLEASPGSRIVQLPDITMKTNTASQP